MTLTQVLILNLVCNWLIIAAFQLWKHRYGFTLWCNAKGVYTTSNCCKVRKKNVINSYFVCVCARYKAVNDWWLLETTVKVVIYVRIALHFLVMGCLFWFLYFSYMCPPLDSYKMRLVLCLKFVKKIKLNTLWRPRTYNFPSHHNYSVA